jgi:hypothetical protein
MARIFVAPTQRRCPKPGTANASGGDPFETVLVLEFDADVASVNCIPSERKLVICSNLC